MFREENLLLYIVDKKKKKIHVHSNSILNTLVINLLFSDKKTMQLHIF